MLHRITSTSLSLLFLSGCMMEGDPSEATGALVVTDRCEISGLGALPMGDFFTGRARGGDLGATGSWLHTGPDGVVQGQPDFILCRINGAVLGDIGGPATIDGRSGYTFRVSVQDFGEAGPPELVEGPPEVQTVTATRRYCPSEWEDGAVAIEERAIVTVPHELPVTVGNAGNQWAWVTFERSEQGDRVVCRYRGGASRSSPCTDEDIEAGLSYRFVRCTGESGGPADVEAGDRIDVTSAVVHVQNGDDTQPTRREPQTTVSVDFEVSPLVWQEHPRDYYRVAVWDDETEERVYFREGDLSSGDITVLQLD